MKRSPWFAVSKTLLGALALATFLSSVAAAFPSAYTRAYSLVFPGQKAAETKETPEKGLLVKTAKWECSIDTPVSALHLDDMCMAELRTAFNDAVSPPIAFGQDGSVYSASSDGRVYAMSPRDGSIKWSFATKGRSVALDIGADGTVFAASSRFNEDSSLDEGKVYAFSSSDGTVKWSFAIDGGDITLAIGNDGTLIAQADSSHDDLKGNVYALNPSDGSVKWTWVTGGAAEGSPAIGADGTVYISTTMGVNALNESDGSHLWLAEVRGNMTFCPAAGAGGSVYVASDRGVYAFGGSDGDFLWASRIPATWVYHVPVIGADGTVFILTCDGDGFMPESTDSIFALRPQDGTTKWHLALEHRLMREGPSGPAIAPDGTLYVGTNLGAVYALDPATGIVKWMHAPEGGEGSVCPVVGANGIMYAANQKVYALDPGGRLVWAYSAGDDTHWGTPVIGADGTLYSKCDNGKLYAFEP